MLLLPPEISELGKLGFCDRLCSANSFGFAEAAFWANETFETPDMWHVSVFLSVNTDIFLCVCSIVFILGKKLRI